MKRKIVCKIAVDMGMTALLLLQMGFMLLGQELHEWLGAGMFLLFIAHNLLNLKWYKNLLNGKYTPFRILMTAVNFLVFACMIGLAISGMMMSRHVFSFLQIRKGMSLARELHLLCAYWGFVWMSVHLGLHWNMVTAMLRRARNDTASSQLPRMGAVLVAAYGIYAFLKHQIPSYLFRQSVFAFFDYSQPALSFFADYLCIMGLFLFFAHTGAKLLQNVTTKNFV